MSTNELTWFKSSYSSSGSGDCVEVAPSPTTIHIRDSKNKQGLHLTVTPDAWRDFISLASQAR
ncbi:DUF397 domain-containing protein [Streptomyces sp. F001]|uniref:DUF397 domain-containing protein n=1 Tax=Streptomyces sp. F001 TaxID=1510026 RepID=UPI00101E355C|nr:DUF397 domain-containing protein [Streptomyces sp. F001]RZB16431.1 DUF397 domain-containing protein [Streptomyces sp. F001]